MPRANLWLAVGLSLLGFGAALVAILGPLFTHVIRYHVSNGAVNQIIGGDVAGLVLVAPASLTAAFLVWRRHRAGPVLALGPALYGLYMYSQLALGGDVWRYPGNSERFFLFFLTLFILAGAVGIGSWTAIDRWDLPSGGRWVDRLAGWFYFLVALFLVGGLHLPGLLDAWADTPTGAEYLADPNVFWVVKFMDLGVVVPGLVLAGIGVFMGLDWARVLRYAAVAWGALLGSSVAGMAIVMRASSDPSATMANTIVFSAFAVIALCLAVAVYRPLFARHPRHDEIEPARTEAGRLAPLG